MAKYRVTCDVLISGFATVEVEAGSPEEAALKASQTHNLADLDEPKLTELVECEPGDGDVEEM